MIDQLALTAKSSRSEGTSLIDDFFPTCTVDNQANLRIDSKTIDSKIVDAEGWLGWLVNWPVMESVDRSIQVGGLIRLINGVVPFRSAF